MYNLNLDKRRKQIFFCNFARLYLYQLIMKLKYLFSLLCPFMMGTTLEAQNAYLKDSTLRIDYIFSGDAKHQYISVDEARTFKGWAGRTNHMDKVPLGGNGQITMRDAATDKVLYRHSFSTLFQEWLGTEEATRTTKAFENVFLLPMPKDSVRICVELYDFKQKVIAKLNHPIYPDDILIRPITAAPAPHKYIKKSKMGNKAIDIAIVAEGYTEAEMDVFYQHANDAVKALFAHDPFKKLQDRFNVVAVGTPSKDSGVSIPKQNIWKETALGSHFDTFYSDRYLTTLRLRQLHNALAGIPYEHIIILANTDNYGGGGIYNSYVLSMTKHPSFLPVVVHEFGHSFAGLADEYFYDDQFVEYYYPDVEPWEQNITTLKDFDSKWKDLLDKDCPIPTPDSDKRKIGVFEGGGYQSKGVYRACNDCRMKTNEAPEFCPVCQRALERLIRFYTE